MRVLLPCVRASCVNSSGQRRTTSCCHCARSRRLLREFFRTHNDTATRSCHFACRPVGSPSAYQNADQLDRLLASRQPAVLVPVTSARREAVDRACDAEGDHDGEHTTAATLLAISVGPAIIRRHRRSVARRRTNRNLNAYHRSGSNRRCPMFEIGPLPNWATVALDVPTSGLEPPTHAV